MVETCDEIGHDEVEVTSYADEFRTFYCRRCELMWKGEYNPDYLGKSDE